MRSVFLASESPRRRDLLQKAGVSFRVFPVKVSEFPQENLNCGEQILDIAQRKSRAALDLLKEKETKAFVVISADTEVVFENRLTGKPQSKIQAIEMLQRLSGKTHLVQTGVSLRFWPEDLHVQHLETTEVQFKKLSLDEIQTYVETGAPMDKAGAYGIQDEGRNFVENYRGSFENIVGLPIDWVLEKLKSE